MSQDLGELTGEENKKTGRAALRMNEQGQRLQSVSWKEGGPHRDLIVEAC